MIGTYDSRGKLLQQGENKLSMRFTDPDGDAIIVNDRARTVIGVLPPGIKFPLTDQLYMPFRWDRAPRCR